MFLESKTHNAEGHLEGLGVIFLRFYIKWLSSLLVQGENYCW